MKKVESMRISQCMIVKNEEKNIERALSWGKDLMWEQIVVDTGSTDRTVELAKAMGAKVFYFEWIEDFAAAKNYAISKAKGDWIAFLDADEYMTEQGTAKLKPLFSQLLSRKFDGLSTGWQQLNDEGQIFSSGTQVRFFRNSPDIRYRRRIHEQLESVSGKELRIADAVNEISIFHVGYQKQVEAEKNKSNRNRKLILKELEEHPQDYEMMGYLGDDYFSTGEKEEARKWYLRATEHMPDQIKSYDQRSAVTFTSLMTLLSEQENASWDEVGKVYDQAVRLMPQEADIDYMAGRFFAAQNQAEKAIVYLEAAIEKLNTYGCYNKALILAADLLNAYEVLVKCCYEAGEKQKCLSYAVSYLKYQPYGMAVLNRLLKTFFFQKETHWEETLLQDNAEQEKPDNPAENREVMEFLFRLYSPDSLKDKLFILKTANMSGCHHFAAFFGKQCFSAEERQMLGL